MGNETDNFNPLSELVRVVLGMSNFTLPGVLYSMIEPMNAKYDISIMCMAMLMLL